MTATDPRRTSRIVRDATGAKRAFAPARAADRPATEATDAVEAAYRHGLAEGRAAGERAATEAFERQAASLREGVGAALASMAELGRELTERARALTVELALEAASRIARERIEAGDSIAARALADALAALPEREPVEARVHPDDAEAVAGTVAGAIERELIRLVPDPSIERGGCVVNSKSGTIEATLEVAERAVRAAIEGDPRSAA